MTTKIAKIIEIYASNSTLPEPPVDGILATIAKTGELIPGVPLAQKGVRRVDVIAQLAKTTWEESKHPRAKDGKFGDKGSGEAAKPKPVAGKPTAELSAGGKIAAADAKVRAAHISINAILSFASKNVLVPLGEHGKVFGDVKAIKDWAGVKALADRVQPFANKAGVGKEFAALVTKERIAQMRMRAKEKAAHEEFVHGVRMTPPKEKPIAKPVKVKAAEKEFLGTDDEFTHPEDKKLANERYHQAASDAYLSLKSKIGKNDELYAMAQKFNAHDVKSKADFEKHLDSLYEFGKKAGADWDKVTMNYFKMQAHNGFDNTRKKRIDGEKPMSKPKPPTTPLPEEVKAKLSPEHAKLISQFRENKLTSKKQTDSGGINSSANYTVTIEDDGKAIMKGISKDDGTSYGMPASEVCAYEASVLIGFDCLQPTAHRDEGGKPQSVQAFVEGGICGNRLAMKPPKTPELLNSVSQMIAFDLCMANRDRNLGNFMLDSNGIMRGIDNGLVGLEAGRGNMSGGDVFTRAERNCRDYCTAILGDPHYDRFVKPEHIDQVEAFVNSPAFEKLIETHYSEGTQGGDDLKTRRTPLYLFKQKWIKACNYGIENLREKISERAL